MRGDLTPGTRSGVDARIAPKVETETKDFMGRGQKHSVHGEAKMVSGAAEKISSMRVKQESESDSPRKRPGSSEGGHV